MGFFWSGLVRGWGFLCGMWRTFSISWWPRWARPNAPPNPDVGSLPAIEHDLEACIEDSADNHASNLETESLLQNELVQPLLAHPVLAEEQEHPFVVIDGTVEDANDALIIEDAAGAGAASPISSSPATEQPAQAAGEVQQLSTATVLSNEPSESRLTSPEKVKDEVSFVISGLGSELNFLMCFILLLVFKIIIFAGCLSGR
jgi:hypothetical protein